MNDKNESAATPGQKRHYEKPALVVVSLRPDEAVLGACKSNSATGPGGGGCRSVGSPCSSLGS